MGFKRFLSVTLMYQLRRSTGSNGFTLNTGSLSAGTYFVLARNTSSSNSGSYTLSAQKTA